MRWIAYRWVWAIPCRTRQYVIVPAGTTLTAFALPQR
jgi:hypothetical protein